MKAITVTIALLLLPLSAIAESSDHNVTYLLDQREVIVCPPRDYWFRRFHREHRRPPLVRVRSHFVDIMLKSVEDI